MTANDATVFVVDDDPSICRGLSRLLRSAGWHAETFSSAQQFLNHALPDGPGCLVLDVSMPRLSGLDLQAELAARQSAIPIVFITGHGDIPTSVRAMKGGAVDFLTKPFNDQQLLGVIQQAIERDRRRQAVEAEKAALLDRLGTLTAREHEVLRWVIKGWLNKQVAAELGTCEKTIKVHRGRVMRKLQVASVAELVQLAAKAGIPPAEPRPPPPQLGPVPRLPLAPGAAAPARAVTLSAPCAGPPRPVGWPKVQ
ncbi:MAG: response regulator transcription factor [Verrucomicrobia bacterium]|nr:response regulator transcription factor [Verrucomicrobiota bacterium]